MDAVGTWKNPIDLTTYEIDTFHDFTASSQIPLQNSAQGDLSSLKEQRLNDVLSTLLSI